MKMIALRAFQSIVYGNIAEGEAFEARASDVEPFLSLGLARRTETVAAASPEPVEPVEADDAASAKRKGRK